MNFEAYLQSKRIDSAAFMQSEKDLWESLKMDFDQMSPASFTAQKLYLINPIRRKYQLTVEVIKPVSQELNATAGVVHQEKSVPDEKTVQPAKPSVARPVIRPKPKMN